MRTIHSESGMKSWSILKRAMRSVHSIPLIKKMDIYNYRLLIFTFTCSSVEPHNSTLAKTILHEAAGAERLGGSILEEVADVRLGLIVDRNL